MTDLQARLWADNPATEVPLGLKNLRPLGPRRHPRYPKGDHWPHKYRGCRGRDPWANPQFRRTMIDAFTFLGWRT